jgi:hypothetical protein
LSIPGISNCNSYLSPLSTMSQSGNLISLSISANTGKRQPVIEYGHGWNMLSISLLKSSKISSICRLIGTNGLALSVLFIFDFSEVALVRGFVNYLILEVGLQCHALKLSISIELSIIIFCLLLSHNPSYHQSFNAPTSKQVWHAKTIR